PATATDANYLLIESVVAHEYFHNWTGNRITCRDWFQLCVKEGLTVYRDQEFTSDLRSRPLTRLDTVARLKAQQWPEDHGPLAHPPRPDHYKEISNFYTATVYEKGAEIVRMLATRLGKEGFRAGMDLYRARHDNQAITVEDFVLALGDANDEDLSAFLAWYRESGTPVVALRHDYNKQAGRLTVEVKPLPPEGQAVTPKVGKPIPLRIGVIDEAGQEYPIPATTSGLIGHDLIELTDKPISFTIDKLTRPCVPALLRGFSAPVQIRSELTLEEQLILFRHERDPYLRFDSIRQAEQNAMIGMLQGEKSAEDDYRLIAATMAELISCKETGLAFLARLILPKVTFEELQIAIPGVLPLDRIFEVQDKVKQFIAEASSELARARLGNEKLIEEPYSPSDVQIDQRSFRNSLLRLQAFDHSPSGLELVRAAYRDAKSLTERLGALSTIAHEDLAERDNFLSEFRGRVGSNGLLFDKWAGIVASIDDEPNLGRLEQAVKDPLFASTNPNRVYGLIGAFAFRNPRLLHLSDGSGYAFFFEALERLNVINPQVASRLMTAL
ncbi:hypothetical protein CAPTEDRAFT_28641, partial [Capitella teleta]